MILLHKIIQVQIDKAIHQQSMMKVSMVVHAICDHFHSESLAKKHALRGIGLETVEYVDEAGVKYPLTWEVILAGNKYLYVPNIIYLQVVDNAAQVGLDLEKIGETLLFFKQREQLLYKLAFSLLTPQRLLRLYMKDSKESRSYSPLSTSSVEGRHWHGEDGLEHAVVSVAFDKEISLFDGESATPESTTTFSGILKSYMKMLGLSEQYIEVHLNVQRSYTGVAPHYKWFYEVSWKDISRTERLTRNIFALQQLPFFRAHIRHQYTGLGGDPLALALAQKLHQGLVPLSNEIATLSQEVKIIQKVLFAAPATGLAQYQFLRAFVAQSYKDFPQRQYFLLLIGVDYNGIVRNDELEVFSTISVLNDYLHEGVERLVGYDAAAGTYGLLISDLDDESAIVRSRELITEISSDTDFWAGAQRRVCVGIVQISTVTKNIDMVLDCAQQSLASARGLPTDNIVLYATPVISAGAHDSFAQQPAALQESYLEYQDNPLAYAALQSEQQDLLSLQIKREELQQDLKIVRNLLGTDQHTGLPTGDSLIAYLEQAFIDDSSRRYTIMLIALAQGQRDNQDIGPTISLLKTEYLRKELGRLFSFQRGVLAVLIPDLDQVAVRKLAQLIQYGISEDTNEELWSGQSAVSIGLVQGNSGTASSPEAFLDQAKVALTTAIASEKNKIVFFTE